MSRRKRQKPTNPTLINTPGELIELCNLLGTRTIIALDTESDSLFSYYPKVCLIQVSIYADSEETNPRQVLDFLIDPLRLDHLDPLGDLVADPRREIILHAAENDILTLQRDFQFSFGRIYDTQLAARILGWKGVGLARILEDQFGFVADKRMQRTNWGARPLTPQQINYAQMDTHYLPALRALQIDELTRLTRLEEARAAFRFLTEIDYASRPTAERTFWSMKASRKIAPDHAAVLEALWEWREEEAQRRNRPPFKIANDSTLVQIAQTEPSTWNELKQSNTLSASQLKRYGDELLEAVETGKTRPRPEPPVNNHYRPESLLDSAAQSRYEALRKWRSKKAKQRGVDSDIVFTNSTLMAIAQATPRSVAELEEVDGVGSWKAQAYGPDIFPLVNGRR